MNIRIKGIIVLLVIFLFCNSFLFAEDLTQKIDTLLKAYEQNLEFNGTVLVAKDGKVIYKNAFGLANRELDVPCKIDTKYRIGSMSKSFTAMVVLKLVEEGKISLDGKLSDYLKNFPKEKGDKITIHQLLSHTSGIGHYGQVPEFEEWYERLYTATDELIEYFGKIDLLFEPGKEYSYSSFGYNLLAFVCEKVEGKPFSEVLRDKILEPLGMTDTSMIDNRSILQNMASGYKWDQLTGFYKPSYLDGSKVVGGGGMISTVDDIFKWDKALNSEKIISKEMLSKMLQPHAQMNSSQSYGYGWMIYHHPEIDETVYFHGGSVNGFRSMITRYVDSGYLIVILTNVQADGAGGGYVKIGNVNMIQRDIRRILYDKPYDLPKKSAANEIARITYLDGAKEAVYRFEEIKQKQPDGYYISEQEINNFGYNLYARYKRFDDALTVFELNSKEFPNSFNVYDSLGWLYEKKGNNDLALKYYKKALEVYKQYPEDNKRWERASRKAEETVSRLESCSK